jgi:tetratricopeptide (TPR) repeat protein
VRIAARRAALVAVALCAGAVLSACQPRQAAPTTIDRPAAEEALERGWAAHEAGDWRDAENSYLESLHHDPTFVWAYYRLGVLAANFHRWGSAEAYFWRAIEVDPGFMPPYYELGVRRAMAGEREGAVELLRRAVELAPADPYARLQLGRAYEALGEHAKALEQFDAARQLEPEADAILAALPPRGDR